MNCDHVQNATAAAGLRSFWWVGGKTAERTQKKHAHEKKHVVQSLTSSNCIGCARTHLEPGPGRQPIIGIRVPLLGQIPLRAALGSVTFAARCTGSGHLC